MLRRPGCLTPIVFVFVAGCLLVAGGLAADSTQSVRAGVVCLLVGVALSVLGWWMRKHGWWD
jgi:hypothetical protein